MKHLWRNRLARSAVNRKVGGSSPPRCDFFFAVIFSVFVCTFLQVTHCGRVIELIPGGSRVPVTPDRVHEYVQ